MTLTNETINSYIETLKGETSTLNDDLEIALNKKERAQILRRHTNLERIIKLLYSLKAYNED
jgi:ribosomal protein S2